MATREAQSQNLEAFPRLLIRRCEEDEAPEAAREYLLCESIGSGGQAEVYRAQEQFGLHREVAIKRLRVPSLGDAKAEAVMVRRFIRESAIALSMEHPHLVKVYDVGIDTEGFWFYAMELVPGKTLAALIDQLYAAYGRGERADPKTGLIQTSLVRPQKLLRFCHQILDAVGALHAKGILHRDLKPENFLLKSTEYLLLADCGIAKPNSYEAVAAFGGTLTVDHRSFLGTPHYMAPEQLGWKYQVLPEGKQRPWGVCEASDIWAIGVILYELVTGHVPFTVAADEGMEALKGRIESENVPVPPFSTYVANPDARIEEFVLHLLEKKPWKRPASIPEVQRLFQKMVLDQPPPRKQSAQTLDAPPREAEQSVQAHEPPRVQQPSRARKAVIPVLFFCLVAFGAFFLWKRSGMTFAPGVSSSSVPTFVSASETGSTPIPSSPTIAVSVSTKQKQGSGPKSGSPEDRQYQLGIARAKAGDCVAASRFMLQLRMKHPDFAPPLLVLADCARQKRLIPEACEQYNTYLGYEGVPPLASSAQTFYAVRCARP